MKTVENKALLECRFTNGMKMLPFFHCKIVWDLSYTYWIIKTFTIPNYKIAFRLLKSIPHCKLKKCDILFMSNTVHEFVIDGRYKNKLLGDYYEKYPERSFMIEGLGRDFLWKTTDSYPNLSFIITPLFHLCNKLASVANKFKPRYNKDYDIFINEYPSIFNNSYLGQQDYFVSIYTFFIKKILSYTNPKLLFLEDASYGIEKAVICKVSHDLGIKVIEPQHGTVVEHAAYTSSAIIKSQSDYYEYLPDCIFTFGKYWEQYIHWDYEKYTAGNAYLNNFIKNRTPHACAYDFLIISQGLEDKYRHDFIKKLSSLFSDSKILMRLHPEEDYQKNLEEFKDNNNITFSNGTTLYEDIDRSEIIIGWNSTCLIEALAFGKIPYIVDCLISRKHFPNDIGRWVKDPSEIQLYDDSSKDNYVDYTYYWADNFDERITSYIDKVLSGVSS